jgi:hypothetical protein
VPLLKIDKNYSQNLFLNFNSFVDAKYDDFIKFFIPILVFTISVDILTNIMKSTQFEKYIGKLQPNKPNTTKILNDIYENKKTAVSEVKQLFKNELKNSEINIKTIKDTKEFVSEKIKEANEQIIENQKDTIVTNNDIELLQHPKQKKNAKEKLIVFEKKYFTKAKLTIKNAINKLEKNDSKQNDIEKEIKKFLQIKFEIDKNLNIYNKTINTLFETFLFSPIENLEKSYKNNSKEGNIAKLTEILIYLDICINLYKFIFGLEINYISKLSTEEKEIIKNNEEKLKKLEKELLEKVAKGQKISTSKKTSSKSKSKSKSKK